ncbi:helix-turn-helix domain-containing protein [Bradyrhizobium sp. CB3481]|uniref:MarR family transcriptional regulator n=1 Tax=Bradyrhizobium sp. CB3481 TaxID=3039158 RepID=UPI0024B169C4|nr:helix-turn-helix domain-containing protein [Bradyrhizobium sp. CB3481]WFU14852.1 helix-turn-helix domain-containing protein [Bradyrhizobium sp. CB3481]
MDSFRQFQANVLGITGPQWTILMALAHTDRENGVPPHVVSKMMGVELFIRYDPIKDTGEKGFLRRNPSISDAPVVQMSLTDKTYKHLAMPRSTTGSIQ